MVKRIKLLYLHIKLHNSLHQQIRWYNNCTDPLKKSMLSMMVGMSWMLYSKIKFPRYVAWCLTPPNVPEELRNEDVVVAPSATMLKEITIAATNERNSSMDA